MKRALWNKEVVAEAADEDLIYIEGNWYFPTAAVNKKFLKESNTPYTCPWKGECRYFDVGSGDNWSKDNAWSYPNPKKTAIAIVKKDFSNYVAFWRDVSVVDHKS